MENRERVVHELKQIAAKMQSLKSRFTRVAYAPLADALYWTDEIPDGLTRDQDDLIRIILRYRTSIIAESLDEEWKEYWDEAHLHFPNWIGFRNDRVSPNTDLQKFYHSESQKFDESLELEMDN